MKRNLCSGLRKRRCVNFDHQNATATTKPSLHVCVLGFQAEGNYTKLLDAYVGSVNLQTGNDEKQKSNKSTKLKQISWPLYY